MKKILPAWANSDQKTKKYLAGLPSFCVFIPAVSGLRSWAATGGPRSAPVVLCDESFNGQPLWWPLRTVSCRAVERAAIAARQGKRQKGL
jgi:hypothetical protein